MLLAKIVLLGDGAVGKTSMRNRYMGKQFTQDYIMTIGADFGVYSTEIQTDEGPKSIKFTIWDLAGQPRYNTVREVYYRGSHGALVIYDISRRETLINLKKWISELWEHSGRIVPILLIGNKVDLREHLIETISKEEGAAFTEEIKKLMESRGILSTCHNLETSAKTGENISLAFELLGKQIHAHQMGLDQETSESLFMKRIDQMLTKTFTRVSGDLSFFLKSTTYISGMDDIEWTIDKSNLEHNLMSIEEELVDFLDKRDFHFDIFGILDRDEISIILSLLEALTNSLEGKSSNQLLLMFKDWIYLLYENTFLKMVIDRRSLSIDQKFSNSLVKCCYYFRSRNSPRAKTLSLFLLILREIFGAPFEDVLDVELKIVYNRIFQSKDEDHIQLKSLIRNYVSRGEFWQYHQIIEFFLSDAREIFFSNMHKKALYSLLVLLKEISSRFSVKMKLILERGESDVIKVDLVVDDVTGQNFGFEWDLELLYVGKEQVDERKNQKFSGRFKSDPPPHSISREFHPIDTGLHIFQFSIYEPISNFHHYYQTHLDYKKKSDVGQDDLPILEAIKTLWESYLEVNPQEILQKDHITQELTKLYNLLKFMNQKTVDLIDSTYRSIIGNILSNFLDIKEEINGTKSLLGRVGQRLDHFQWIDPQLLTASKTLIHYDLNNEYFNNTYHLFNIFSHLGVVIKGITKYEKILSREVDFVPREDRVLILYLHANPKDKDFRLPLDVNKEINKIREQIEKEKFDDKIESKNFGHLQFKNLPYYLRKYKPHIVHFTGHGEKDGQLILVNDRGRAKRIKLDNFVNAFKPHKERLHLIMLNACWSAIFAKALAKHIDCVIGWSTDVNQEVASNFSTHFFGGLAGGLSIQESYESARDLIDSEFYPKAIHLERRDGVDPSTIRLFDLPDNTRHKR
ncbi:MAG: GTP-binding protein [Candidatus Hodarchaeota archaeon]